MQLPLAAHEITIQDDPTLETITLTLYVQGCVRRCVGCFNPELQMFDESKNIDIEEIKKLIKSRTPTIESVVFEGGDFLPVFEKQLEILVDYCISLNLKTILYTGETYENIPSVLKQKIDIIVSEPFNINQKSGKFPASKNQKVWINGINVDPDTLEINRRLFDGR